MSIRMLTCMAKWHPVLYARLSPRANMDYAKQGGGYPFACAGVNIAFLLVDALKLTRTGDPPSGGDAASVKARKKLAVLVGDAGGGERAVCWVFACIFAALDCEWERTGATYMQFSQVVKTVRGALLQALGSMKVQSLQQLATHLGVAV